MLKKMILKSKLVMTLRVAKEKLFDVFFFSKHLANRNVSSNLEYMKTDLIIRAHALEKGMSIGSVKIGFGKPKAFSLMKDLSVFLSKGGDQSFGSEVCSIVGKYIDFNNSLGADMADVEKEYQALQKKFSLDAVADVGILNINHEELLNATNSPFDIFSQTRYSVRDLGDNPLDLDSVKKALALCERTPSACNRQSWRVHVYLDKEKKNNILNLQLGNKGFTDDLQGAILICSNINRYAFPEFYNPYVDCGLYAMNLMYALRFYDIASIPLTMGHKHSHMKKIRKVMNLPENEMPVILIGIGSYKKSFKVAVSKRYPFPTYTRIDQ